MDYIIAICSCIGSLTALVIFLVTRHDNKKKEKKANIITKTDFDKYMTEINNRLEEGNRQFAFLTEKTKDLESNDYTNAELIGRHKAILERHSEEIKETQISEKLLKADIQSTKRENSRQSLLLLLSLFPKKTDAILTEAKVYFIDYKGDSYVHSLFDDWLKKVKIEEPEWYGETKKN